MNIFSNYLLRNFYLPILENYSLLKSNGVQLIDIKCQIVKNVLQLDTSKYLNENSIRMIKKLDIIELILFFIWFNSSLGKKYSIPKIFIPDKNFLIEKQEIINVAFNNGNWWYIKDDINDSNFNLIPYFTELGENLILSYQLI